MCSNEICALRTDCYRSPDSGTKPGWQQSYSAFEPIDDEDCKFFEPRHIRPGTQHVSPVRKAASL